MTTTKIQNACCVWDFTLPCGDLHYTDVAKLLNENCKKWSFQQERGEKTGFIHFQGRVSLKVKCRKPFKLFNAHWSVTSGSNMDNDFYVCKEETRIDGPWSDKTYSKPMYIPRQVKEHETFLPWQATAVDMSENWDPRSINVIFDPTGNNGKSYFAMWMLTHGKGRIVPFINNCKDLMRMVCDLPISNCYIIDIPRSIKKTELRGLFAGIEMIKNGYAFDDRYTFKEITFDSPTIWVFVNKLPKLSYLSADRWKVYSIVNLHLVSYVPKAEDYASSGKKRR